MSVWPWYAGARAGIAKCRDVCLRVLPVEGEECQVPGLDDVCLFVHVMCVAWCARADSTCKCAGTISQGAELCTAWVEQPRSRAFAVRGLCSCERAAHLCACRVCCGVRCRLRV